METIEDVPCKNIGSRFTVCVQYICAEMVMGPSAPKA